MRDGGLGEPEIEELHAGTRQEDVSGLQVAVDDAGPVGGVEPRRDLDAKPQERIERQRSLGDPLGERLPFEVLHDEYGAPSCCPTS